MDRRTSGDDNWQFTGDFYSKMWECLVLVSTRNVRLWNVRYWENYKCEIFLTCARRTDGQKCTIKTSFSDDSSSLLSGAALTTCFGKTAPFCMFWTKKTTAYISLISHHHQHYVFNCSINMWCNVSKKNCHAQKIVRWLTVHETKMT